MFRPWECQVKKNKKTEISDLYAKIVAPGLRNA